MKILVLGAGATGGYFGGRLLQAGRDVSFLVRPRRALTLRQQGLAIRSRLGDAQLRPAVITTGKLASQFELVLLCCKAYDLDSAVAAIAPAVGPQTTILPLLNGMRHFEVLDETFGAARVLGGLCSIAVTVGSDGAVEHLGSTHLLRFGERDGSRTPRLAKLEAQFAGAGLDAKPSRNIMAALWEKWTMLASLAAMNCLMRASIGDILAAPGGRALCLQMVDECTAIGAAHGHPPRPQLLDDVRAFLAQAGGAFTASMLRDVEKSNRVEADHIVGDLIARAEEKAVATPLLRIAYTSLKIYEATRSRKT